MATPALRLGLSTFVTDYSIPITDLAVAAEERGFDALIVTEHTHIPVGSQGDHPSGDLAREYYRTLDPFVTLGAAAAVTSRARPAAGDAVQRVPEAGAAGGDRRGGRGAGPPACAYRARAVTRSCRSSTTTPGY